MIAETISVLLLVAAAISWVWVVNTSRSHLPIDQWYSERQAMIRGSIPWVATLAFLVAVCSAFLN